MIVYIYDKVCQKMVEAVPRKRARSPRWLAGMGENTLLSRMYDSPVDRKKAIERRLYCLSYYSDELFLKDYSASRVDA